MTEETHDATRDPATDAQPDESTPDDPEDIDPTLPEIVQKMLRAGATLEPIRLDRRGRWWHRGNPIEHARIHRLFSRSVDQTEGGTWVLRVDPFTYPIEVEDTPYFVREWHVDDTGDAAADDVELELSDGTRMPVDIEALCYDDTGLYVRGVGPGGRFEARFHLVPYVSFVETFVEQDGDGFAIRDRDGHLVELPRR